MTPLRDTLLDAYGGYADKRLKDRSLDRPIQIDDKGPHDVYPFFCTISAQVPERTGNTLVLSLQNCPASPDVLELVEVFGGSVETTGPRANVVLTLKSSQSPALKRLAEAIRGVVGQDRSYDDSNLRSICARTASALEQLAEHLALHRSELYPEDFEHSPDPILARRRRTDIPTCRASLPDQPRSSKD